MAAASRFLTRLRVFNEGDLSRYYPAVVEPLGIGWQLLLFSASVGESILLFRVAWLLGGRFEVPREGATDLRDPHTQTGDL